SGQQNLTSAGAERDLQVGTAIEFQVRAIGQLDLATLTQGSLQICVMVQALVLPAAPPQPQRGQRDPSGQGLTQQATTRQPLHGLGLAQCLQVLARNEVGGLPQPAQLFIFLAVPGMRSEPLAQLRLQFVILGSILDAGEPFGRLVADGIGTVLFHEKALLTHLDTSRCSRRCRSVRIIYFSTMFLVKPMRSAISAWLSPSSFCQMKTRRQLTGSCANARSTLSASSRACT